MFSSFRSNSKFFFRLHNILLHYRTQLTNVNISTLLPSSSSTITASSILVGALYLANTQKQVAVNDSGSSSYHKKNGEFSRNFIADAAAIVAPSVVNILSISKGFIPVGSGGSGFIITEDGFVVTNAHVVANAANQQVEVTTADGRKMAGKIHGIDRKSDIAVVKVDTKGEKLPTSKFGVSGKLRAGEFVVAVGSPYMLHNSVTFGIVSAPARHSSEIGLMGQNSDFIQTDASINVGNSGGPLVNLDGEVIGINTMKAQASGISFAIPIDTASHIISQLISRGRVIRPYIGLSIVSFIPGNKSKEIIYVPNDSANSDAFVQIVEVAPNSPAYAAGLKSGDIIVSVDGKEVHHTKQVIDMIASCDVGQKFTFRVKDLSTDRVRELTVTTIDADKYH